MTNKSEYLNDTERFVEWLIEITEGKNTIDHRFRIRDRKLPNDYCFGIEFAAANLKEAFDRYWWDGKDYRGNAAVLDEVQAVVRASLNDESPERATIAIDKVLEWGAGGKRANLYIKNMDWAREVGNSLVKRLAAGRAAMNSDSLEAARIFSQPDGPRMNAGYTKYYALACDKCIIYDGRVGAALGLLVRTYLQRPELPSRGEVPPCLAFRWGAQNGNNPLNRNPSLAPLVFSQLPTAGGRIWAEWNKKANWILNSVAARSTASWLKGHPDCLRRLEAALFTLGYAV